jgi:hypothetical protein
VNFRFWPVCVINRRDKLCGSFREIWASGIDPKRIWQKGESGRSAIEMVRVGVMRWHYQ